MEGKEEEAKKCIHAPHCPLRLVANYARKTQALALLRCACMYAVWNVGLVCSFFFASPALPQTISTTFSTGLVVVYSLHNQHIECFLLVLHRVQHCLPKCLCVFIFQQHLALNVPRSVESEIIGSKK